MYTVQTCQKSVNRFWSIDENKTVEYAVTPHLTDEQVSEMKYRYTNRPNPNMKGLSWLPQEGDEGIGFRHTQPKWRR